MRFIMLDNRFIIQPSTRQRDWWVCTDKANGLVCRFETHKFNDTQKFTFLEDMEQSDALTIARIVREMADWLRSNHYEKVF